MVPLNVVIIIIVIQCLINQLGIWALSKEKKEKDKVIEKISKELSDKVFLIRTYKRLLEEKEKLLEEK